MGRALPSLKENNYDCSPFFIELNVKYKNSIFNHYLKQYILIIKGQDSMLKDNYKKGEVEGRGEVLEFHFE